MLEALQLTEFYGSTPAVQNVSFQILPGSVLGYLGPNGSGKSTTVKMLIGLLQPTHGEVRFDGHSIQQDLLTYRKRLGYVPEEPNLYPHLSGWEYLEMVGTLRGMSEAALSSKAGKLLELLSLSANKHVQMSSYSKGMRQRILLIAALMDNPDVLVLDEPLSGLDVTSAMVAKNLIQILAAKANQSFIALTFWRSLKKSVLSSSSFAKAACSRPAQPKTFASRLANPRSSRRSCS